jgi:uncharacterized protein
MPRFLAPAALAVLLAASAAALDTSKLQPTGYVNDFARALDPRSRAALEDYCANLERLTGVQVAVVLVDSLEGEPIEDAANRLFRQWGIGKKGKDEGLLLMLAIHDRKQRAEVGYGLEGIIPDGYAGSVLRGIRPILRQGDYGGALLAALQQYGQRIGDEKGVDLSGGTGRRPAPPVGPGGSLPWPVVLGGLFLLLIILGSLGGGGGGGGFLLGMILGNLLGRGGRRDGWGGGGFGGYNGGGGGFGGFGGGDSGGGGASSDW